MPYITSEMASIMQYVQEQLGENDVSSSLHFSPTALTLVRRVMMSGGSIVADTALVLSDIDRESAQKLGVQLVCHLDDEQVVALAEQKRITRAEIALDHALAQPGSKLLVVGSAPMALNRLLQRAAHETLNDVIVLAAATGFASVVQLKERIWDSELPSIVVRGKKGGAAAAAAIVNALMTQSIKQQNL